MNNNWDLVRIANGHLSCDNATMEAKDIDAVEKQIEEKFGAGSLRKNRIQTGWDNWSGLFIMSHDNSGDYFVKRIYEYLCELENEQPASIIEMFETTSKVSKSTSIIEQIKNIIDQIKNPKH